MVGFFGKFTPARVASSMLFFANGMLIGMWTPMIPVFKARLGLTESEMGFVILALGVGSLTSMPIVGALVSQIGTRIPIIYNAILCSFGLPLITLAPNYILTLVIMFFFGSFWAGMDVAMNSNAIEVERKYRQAIMSSCHGFWSLGGVAGALFGGLTLASFGEFGHAVFWMISFLLLFAFAYTKLETGGINPIGEEKPKLALPRSILPYLLGGVALFSVVPEGVVIDWSALFLREERSFNLATAGYGFAACSTAMALMRFLGDSIRQKYGAVTTLRVCSVTSVVGFVVITISTSPIVIISGFFIAGLGLSNLFPIAVSAAGNLPDIPSGIAVSIVTTVGYSGILLAPALFGFVAQIWSYSVVFGLMPICLTLVFFMVYPARHADMKMGVKE